MKFIAFPSQEQTSSLWGGKARGLAVLHGAGLPIPGWFVLLPAAFYASMSRANFARAGLANPAQSGDLSIPSEQISDLLEAGEALAPRHLTPGAQAELRQALAQLCPDDQPVAVRSSALEEDGENYSFAGQLESFLEVPPAQVAERVVDVWRSAFNPRVAAYRQEHGLPLRLRPPAVLIQRMVAATASGVAFSADPVTGQRDLAVVAATPGLGQALVSGATEGDTYHVDRQGRIVKRSLVGPVNEGNSVGVRIARKRRTPTVTDYQVQAIAALARQVEQLSGRPQDIEWALEGEELYLLQARPITGLPPDPGQVAMTLEDDLPEAEGALNLWDNSNIAESYPGVTTPLTFSFARRAYEEVYRQFCRMMGVPATTIAAHDLTFKRMLGFMQGQIYYNLLSWYRVLALLPGYKLNRRFMEQMMGVKESLPDELLDQQTVPSQGERLKDGLYLLRTLAALIMNYLLLPRRIEAFYARLEAALGPGRPDLSQQTPEELVAYYRRLEGQLLPCWDAPLINDFFAMIFYGLLRKLVEKWLNDPYGSLQNTLLFGSGGIISAEPAQAMQRMAQLATADPALVELLYAGSLEEIRAYLPRQPQFERQYQAYLDRFGDRCLEELKLESPTLHDDPLLLLRSIGQLARNRPVGQNGSGPESNRQPGVEAKARVQAALSGRPLRAWLFNWVLESTRRLIRNRENLRFERTRLFGRARMIFVELGRRFYERGWLAEPRDIFYLEVQEILGLVEGTTSTTDLQSLVALRRAEFQAYEAQPPLPNRFETRGIPYQKFKRGSQEDQPETSGPISPQSDRLQGLGCSPGIVRGPVRLVTDPKVARLQPGEILVAERTDPGWIVLFPAASGLLVEYGSLLSHSAIVSRELGLPAIVSLTGITRWLKDGDWVEFDGSAGVVTRLERPHA